MFKIDIDIHLNGTLIFAFCLFFAALAIEIVGMRILNSMPGVFVPVASVAGGLAGCRKLADKIGEKK